MQAFTKLHHDDVPNAAEAFGMGEYQDSRFFTKELGSDQVGLAWHRLRAGKRSPIAHRHREQDEVYVVVSGSGHAKLADEVVELAAGDVLLVPARTARGFEAGDDGLEFLAFGTRRPNDICFYPRSNKVFFRGIGLITRLEHLDYMDGEL